MIFVLLRVEGDNQNHKYIFYNIIKIEDTQKSLYISQIEKECSTKDKVHYYLG